MFEPPKHNCRYHFIFLILEHYPELAYLLTLEINQLREPLTVKRVHLHYRKWIPMSYLIIWFLFKLPPNFIVWKLLTLYDLLLKDLLKYFLTHNIFQSVNCLWYFMRCMMEPLGKLTLGDVFYALLYQKRINVLLFHQELEGLTRVGMLCKDAEDRQFSCIVICQV